MRLQHQTVSRKTPNDGLLEITSETASRIAPLGTEFRLAIESDEDGASVRNLTCTCGKRGEGTHTHYFLESPILRTLVPGADVAVELDDAGRVRISPVSALPST